MLMCEAELGRRGHQRRVTFLPADVSASRSTTSLSDEERSISERSDAVADFESCASDQKHRTPSPVRLVERRTDLRQLDRTFPRNQASQSWDRESKLQEDSIESSSVNDSRANGSASAGCVPGSCANAAYAAGGPVAVFPPPSSIQTPVVLTRAMNYLPMSCASSPVAAASAGGSDLASELPQHAHSESVSATPVEPTAAIRRPHEHSSYQGHRCICSSSCTECGSSQACDATGLGVCQCRQSASGHTTSLPEARGGASSAARSPTGIADRIQQRSTSSSISLEVVREPKLQPEKLLTDGLSACSTSSMATSRSASPHSVQCSRRSFDTQETISSDSGSTNSRGSGGAAKRSTTPAKRQQDTSLQMKPNISLLQEAETPWNFGAASGFGGGGFSSSNWDFDAKSADDDYS